MIFCENCFNDKEIISIICSVPLLNTGKCPLCHNEGHLYNTDTQNFLTPYFEELLYMLLQLLFRKPIPELKFDH